MEVIQNTADTLTFEIRVNGALTDGTATVQVVKPDGSNLYTSAQTPSNVSTGTYTLALTSAKTATLGTHKAIFNYQTPSDGTGQYEQFFEIINSTFGADNYTLQNAIDEIREKLPTQAITQLTAALSDTTATTPTFQLAENVDPYGEVSVELETLRGMGNGTFKRGFSNTTAATHANNSLVWIGSPTTAHIRNILRSVVEGLYPKIYKRHHITVTASTQFDLPDGLTAKNIMSISQRPSETNSTDSTGASTIRTIRALRKWNIQGQRMYTDTDDGDFLIGFYCRYEGFYNWNSLTSNTDLPEEIRQAVILKTASILYKPQGENDITGRQYRDQANQTLKDNRSPMRTSPLRVK